MLNRALVAAAVAGLAMSVSPASAEPGEVLVAAQQGAVAFDAAAFAQGEVVFALPGGERVLGTVTSHTQRGEGSASWGGTIRSDDLGIEQGYFSVATSNGVAHGAVWAGDLGVYEIRSRGDETGLYDTVRIDTIDFPNCAGPVLPEAAGRGVPGVRERAHLAEAAEQKSDVAKARGGDDGSVIDVMIVYTAQARSGWGGTNAIEALAQNSIDITNTAYANSDIGPLQLRLVHTYEVSYSESNDAITDLVALTNTNDGAMDEVHQLRDQFGADLVAMLVNSFNACGIGYLAPFNDNFGFTVTDTGCAVGNLSFPHEIGHNMGTTHDRGNGNNSQFSYGYGWRWDGSNGTEYRSVMAYSPGSRVPHFSNPDISYLGGATGTVTDDNARVHDQTRTSVATFRQSVVTSDCLPDTNGDGLVTPADFNAWILAFNANAPACDQNGDGACSPADFNAWILNFNAGC